MELSDYRAVGLSIGSSLRLHHLHNKIQSGNLTQKSRIDHYHHKRKMDIKIVLLQTQQ